MHHLLMSEANETGFKELGGPPPMTFEAGLDSHPLQPLPLYLLDPHRGLGGADRLLLVTGSTNGWGFGSWIDIFVK